jgi:hypothetical protein
LYVSGKRRLVVDIAAPARAAHPMGVAAGRSPLARRFRLRSRIRKP